MSEIKLKKGVNLIDFLQKVKTCKWNVFYKTSESDCLNLKSTLSEYIFAASAIDQSFLEKGEIICEKETDFMELSAYVENRK